MTATPAVTAAHIQGVIDRAAGASLGREDRAAILAELREHITRLLPAAKTAVNELDRGDLAWARGAHRLDLVRYRIDGGNLSRLAADCAWLLSTSNTP